MTAGSGGTFGGVDGSGGSDASGDEDDADEDHDKGGRSGKERSSDADDDDSPTTGDPLPWFIPFIFASGTAGLVMLLARSHARRRGGVR